MDATLGRQLSEQDAQRVGPGQLVVAVRREHQRRQAAQPSRQVTEQVERGLVGPVEVLEDQHGGLGDRLRQGIDEVAGTGSLLHESREVAAELGGEVEQRTVGTRRTEGLGPADDDADRAPRSELVDEGGLARAGLAPDEDQRPLAPLDDLGEAEGDGVELLRPLDQRPGWLGRHRHSVAQRRRPRRR